MSRLMLWNTLSVAMLVRLAVLWVAYHAGGAGLLAPDSPGYLADGHTLAWHGRFAPGKDAPADLVRTPGYPLLLAGVSRLGGGGEDAGMVPYWPAGQLALASLVQALLDVLLVYLTYRLGSLLAGPTVGLVAAALQAVSPVAIAAGVRLLSDGLFALFLTAGLLCLAGELKAGRTSDGKAPPKRRWARLIGAALLLAAGAYVRPIMLYFPLVIAGLLLARRRAKAAAVFVGVFAVCVGPWVVRNGVVGGYPRFSGIQAVNMLEYNAAAVTARLTGASEEEVRRQARAEAGARELTEGQAERYRWESREGWKVVLAHAGLYVWLHLRADANSLLPGSTDLLEAMGVTAGGRGTLEVLRREGIVAAVRHYFGDNRLALLLAGPGLVLEGLLYLGLLLLAGRRLRWRMPPEAWLLLLAGLYFLLLPGPPSLPRFRACVMPVMAVGSAAGLVWLAGRLTRRKASADRPG